MPYACGIMFPHFGGCELTDKSGCVLHSGHVGPHRFQAEDGQIYDWENDYECDCEDCRSEDSEDWCVIYRRVDKSNTTRYVR